MQDGDILLELVAFVNHSFMMIDLQVGCSIYILDIERGLC